MTWTLEYLETAQKSLRKIGKAEAKRITARLSEIAELEYPQSRGHGLTGNLNGFWRFSSG